MNKDIRNRLAALVIAALAIPGVASAQNVPANMTNGTAGASTPGNPASRAPAASPAAAPTPAAGAPAARTLPVTPAANTGYTPMTAIAPMRGVYQKTLLRPRLHGKPDLFLTPAVNPDEMTDKEIYDEAMSHKTWRTLVTINGMRW